MPKTKIPFAHIAKVIRLLDGKERRRLFIVMIGAVLLGGIEIAGVSSIMPFIAVASNPGMITTNEYLHWAYTAFHFSSETTFLIALGVLMLFFVILRNAFSALLMYIQVRFTQGCRHSLSLRLFKYYLGQDYAFFLGKNSYEFSKNINNEIENVINGTILQMVNIMTFGIQILLLGIFLFVVNPLSTLFIFILIAFIYTAIFVGTKKKLNRLGRERYELFTERSRIVNEAFWGIKDVKISGNERIFYNSFGPVSRCFSKNTAAEEVIGVMPKYVLEAAGFSAILLCIMLLMVNSDGGFSSAITSIGLYAYAGYRLMPVMQQFFRSVTKLKYSASGTEMIIKEFRIRKTARPLPYPDITAMPFTDSIRLDHIVFTYPGKEQPVINDISLEIRANTLSGFCGTTGSGKTTTVDIILGLLRPDSGTIAIDGVPLTPENLNSWQKNIGYVPQNIYLSNTTIAENIAFGIPKKEIDLEAVHRAAVMAQIHDFITAELEQGYETKVGERGICLSGGQRQRIGIARALYTNPRLLVMDEATSALDNKTETDVMSAIDNLAGKKTIILIAHRITTLRKCDVIFQITKGKLTAQGTYDQMFRDE
ncbi:MAG: ABC transporter ATP-binding protein/permease [Spirochaetaceae bacterium]|jgi:ABC-type multidrug transport system fused ATPase/permease subunit|nr:ABC transporter ATP-binding protein/permease [Spirochaetaceae bacterium]